jgi:hypothetical protein
VRKQRPKKDLVKFREGATQRVSLTWLQSFTSTFDTTLQSLTLAIVPDGYDSDEPTADVDITMVAHNSIFNPLDGSASHRTPDSDIEIDQLEFEGTLTSVAKDPQGESRTLVIKLLKKTLKPTQNGAYMHLASGILLAIHCSSFSITGCDGIRITDIRVHTQFLHIHHI